MIIWNNLNIQNGSTPSVNINLNNDGRATFKLKEIKFQTSSSVNENSISIIDGTYLTFPRRFYIGKSNTNEFVSYQPDLDNPPTAALLFRNWNPYRYYGFDLYGDLNIAKGNDDYCGGDEHGGNLIVQGNSQINGNLTIDGTISKIELTPDKDGSESNDGSESEENPNSWTAAKGLHCSKAEVSDLVSHETRVMGILNCERDVVADKSIVADGLIQGANIGPFSVKPILWINRTSTVGDYICLLAQHDSTITSFDVKVNGTTTVTDKHFNEVWEIGIPDNGARITIVINEKEIYSVSVEARPDSGEKVYFFELTPCQYLSNYTPHKATIIGRTSEFGAVFAYWSSRRDIDRISTWAWANKQGFNRYHTSDRSGPINNDNNINASYSGIVYFTTESNV